MEGVCREEFSSGQILEGQFVNDYLNGYGRVIYPNGNYYIGMWRHHKKDGPGKYFKKNGKVDDGYFKDDKYVGLQAQADSRLSNVE